MNERKTDEELLRRIQDGSVSKRDVVRRLAELAFGRANDCVKLVMEEEAGVDNLDLSLLCEVKRTAKGEIQVKLVDRLRALELLNLAAAQEDTELEDFLKAMGEAAL